MFRDFVRSGVRVLPLQHYLELRLTVGRLVVIGTNLALLVASAYAGNDQFREVVANSQAFHGKRVTVVGVAHIDPNSFTLYKDARSARTYQRDRAIFVQRNEKSARHLDCDTHWVRVMGIVDARHHGNLGDEACELQLERIERLAPAPEPDQSVYGVFRNEALKKVVVRIQARDGSYLKVGLSPGACIRERINHGAFIVVVPPARDILRDDNAQRLRLTQRNYDAGKRSYYFRILSHGSVAPVSVAAAKNWRVEKP